MSNNCKEFVLDDLMAITAIPVADFMPGMAAWQMTPTINAAALSLPLTHAIVIGQKAATQGGAVIPMMRQTGKAEDSEDNSVAGRLHTVTVSCDVDSRDAGVWSYLLTLERTPCHLLLTFRNATQAFVQATEDTYLFNTKRDGSKTSVTLRIQNMMGIQMTV